MVAPRMIGKGVRETYENGTGFPTFLVVNQDATGHAKEIALGLAKALGSTKAGAIEVTFNDETYLDLMSEQAIWPLIMNVFVTAFNFLEEKGLPAEAILTEMYMSKEPMVMMACSSSCLSTAAPASTARCPASKWWTTPPCGPSSKSSTTASWTAPSPRSGRMSRPTA